MKRILLSPNGKSGNFAIVDDADFDLVRQHTWYACRRSSCQYARTNVRKRGKRSVVSMHRLIMAAKAGQQVDHVNGDGLDNRRRNLRFASTSQNSHNAHSLPRGASRFRGVSRKSSDRWRATICDRGITRYLGSFRSEENAARAYDIAKLELAGEFAATNFPKSHYLPGACAKDNT